MNEQPSSDFLAPFQALPPTLLQKYSKSIQGYQNKIIPFEISRINQNKNLSSKNSSLERHKLDLQQKIVHLTSKNHKQESKMQGQSEKINDLSRTVSDLDRAYNDNLSVITALKYSLKELQAELNENIEAVKRVEQEKKEILKNYEEKKNEYNSLLEHYMKDKNIIAEKLNFMNELEQSLIEKEKQMKDQEMYLKQQWQQFEKEKKEQRQKPKIFKKPSDQVSGQEKKEEEKPQKPMVIDQVLRTPIKKMIKHHSSEIYDAWVSDNGPTLLTCGADRVIKIYDLLHFNNLNTIEGDTESAFLCLSAEGGQGTKLLTGSSDKSVQIYDFKTGKLLNKFVEHGMKVNCVAWLSKEMVVSGSEDKSIKVWCLEKAESIATISCGRHVKCLTAKPNEPLMYSGHSDGSVRVYSPTQPGPVAQIKGLIDRPINSICTTANPNQLLVSSQQGSPIHLLDLKMNKSAMKYEGQDYCNTAGRALTSPAQKYVVAGNCDGYIYYWGKEKGHFEKKVSGHDYGINVIRYSRDGKLVSCDSQGNVIVWQS